MKWFGSCALSEGLVAMVASATGKNLAVLAQAFKDHKENEEKWQGKVDEKLDGIVSTLAAGDGNIRDVREKVESHVAWHRDKKADMQLSLKRYGVIIAVVNVAVIIGVFVIEHFLTR